MKTNAVITRKTEISKQPDMFSYEFDDYREI